MDQANPEKVSDRDSNPFFYDPDELKKLTPLGVPILGLIGTRVRNSSARGPHELVPPPAHS